MSLLTLLIECANREGFPLAGAVDLDLAFSDPENAFQKHVGHFDEWLRAGFAGSMEYLSRGRDRRNDPRLLFPEAKSVFCVAIPYPRQPAGAPSPEEGPRYARYLQGGDYHSEICEKLERVMHAVKSQWNSSELKWKICVDTSAILERSWAALAGLGWIGKNTLLIHPKEGSYLFLGEVLINQATGQGPSPLSDLCGHCTRCLDACPTQALEEPHLLNSNRCISYLTLEKRGKLILEEEAKNKIGSWIAGCDLCQEACPFNLKPSRRDCFPVSSDSNTNAAALSSWEALLQETQENYRQRVKKSALKRVKPAQFSRNLAIALRNGLENSPQKDIALLKSLIQKRIETETDPDAREEWIRTTSVPKS